MIRERLFKFTAAVGFSILIGSAGDFEDHVRDLDGTTFTPAHRFVVSSALDLTQDTTIAADEVVLRAPIVTRNHNLNIITGRLRLADSGFIRTFNSNDLPLEKPAEARSPGVGPSGEDGKWIDHFENGVNHPRGQDGEVGPAGLPGAPGDAGKNAGIILISAHEIVGNLIIDGRGQTGGKGGVGGRGGRGGQGGKGQRGTKDQDSCDGGNGGPGGQGGKGGSSGTGGRGAILILATNSDRSRFNIKVAGGDGGPPQTLIAKGGLGGDGGPGGEQDHGLIPAADADGSQKDGASGAEGSPGVPGDPGIAGLSGAIHYPSVSEVTKSMNEVRDSAFAFQLERKFWVLVNRTFDFAGEQNVTSLGLGLEPAIYDKLIRSWKHFQFFISEDTELGQTFAKASLAVQTSLEVLRNDERSEVDLAELHQNLQTLEITRFSRIVRHIERIASSCISHLDQIQKELGKEIELFDQFPDLPSQKLPVNPYYKVPLCQTIEDFRENPLGEIRIAQPIIPLVIPESLSVSLEKQEIKLFDSILTDPFARLFHLNSFADEPTDEVLDAIWSSKAGEKFSLRFLTHSIFEKRRVTASGILLAFTSPTENKPNTLDDLDFQLRLLGAYVQSFAREQKR